MVGLVDGQLRWRSDHVPLSVVEAMVGRPVVVDDIDVDAIRDHVARGDDAEQRGVDRELCT